MRVEGRHMTPWVLTLIHDFDQVLCEYKCEHDSLVPYCASAKKLLIYFFDFSLNFTVKGNNIKANDLVQYASGYCKL